MFVVEVPVGRVEDHGEASVFNTRVNVKDAVKVCGSRADVREQNECKGTLRGLHYYKTYFLPNPSNCHVTLLTLPKQSHDLPPHSGHMTSPPPQWSHGLTPPQKSQASSPTMVTCLTPPPTKVSCPYPFTLHVRSPDVNNVTDKDAAILLVEINHKGLRLGTIVEFAATVTGHHPVPRAYCAKTL